MELLIVLWLVGIAAYFYFTTPRQRENYLLVAWIVLLAPIAIPIFNWLTR